MPSIVFWPGVPGGTDQYRCHAPGEALGRAGWDVGYVEDEDSVISADVVVFGRVISQLCVEIMRQLKARTNALLVYDIDDWFDAIPEYNPAVNAEIHLVHAAMELADLITVTTPGLAKLYGRFAPTAVLPNYLDPAVWAEVGQRSPHPTTRIGWLAAYKWRGGDMEVLRPWLPGFLQSHRDVRFGAVGCPEMLDDIGIDGFSTPMSPYKDLPKLLAPLDIGIVPLTYNAFNWQGKSWCKSMEYGAMGIPSIASPSEANRAYIRPGVNGQLVKKNNWPQQIERVMDDLDNYRLGARKVAEEYFIDDHIGRWSDAYEQARGRRAPAIQRDLTARTLIG